MGNISVHSIFRKMGRFIILPRHLTTWLLLDAIYLAAIALFWGEKISLSFFEFAIAHGAGIAVGTMVMFTGLGAGVLWIPILTFLHIKTPEAVSISIFTQIAGKGMGSLTYMIAGMVDLKVAGYFIPFSLVGVCVGYVAGFGISAAYEKALLYIFILVACYLLVKMVGSLNIVRKEGQRAIDPAALKKSWPVVVCSSFFTGLLSIGNTDWLIPHMETKLNMSTSRSVATGLFVMFISSCFFLFLTAVSVSLGLKPWPGGTSILFATCSGVIFGGQVGTRLIRYQWFRDRQKHAFILFLALSIVHLLW